MAEPRAVAPRATATSTAPAGIATKNVTWCNRPRRSGFGGESWEAALKEFEGSLAGYAELKGTLAQGASRLLKAFRLEDELGQLSYKLWYYAGLSYDQDQRDNHINGRRQQVQILFAKAQQASAWFNPELLKIPLPTIQQWIADQIPGARVEIFEAEEGGSHFMWLENPAKFKG